MTAVRSLVECFLSGDEAGVDALGIPQDSAVHYDATVWAREPGEAALWPEQTAAVLAALHDARCPGVEKVVALDGEAPAFDDQCKAIPGYLRYVRWRAIRDRVAALGDFALHWLTLQYRRFEQVVREQVPSPTGQPESAATPPPGQCLTPGQTGDGLPLPLSTNESPRQQPEIDQESLAIALLVQHADWSIKQIANHLGVNRATLYKWNKFRVAAERSERLKSRGPRAGRPRRGHKSPDGMIEAYQDDRAGV
jgi:hypothetical protein